MSEDRPRLDDPALAAPFAAAGPSQLPMVRLCERLRRKAYAARLGARSDGAALVVGDEGGAGFSITYWPHVRVFQLRRWDRGTGTEEVRQLNLLAEVERWVDEAAAP
jgi:hypothetical protein